MILNINRLQIGKTVKTSKWLLALIDVMQFRSRPGEYFNPSSGCLIVILFNEDEKNQRDADLCFILLLFRVE